MNIKNRSTNLVLVASAAALSASLFSGAAHARGVRADWLRDHQRNVPQASQAQVTQGDRDGQTSGSAHKRGSAKRSPFLVFSFADIEDPARRERLAEMVNPHSRIWPN